ncbi:hypothetical protein [Ralstonia pseudosolanacearum]
MFGINKLPVIQAATGAVFDTSRVKEVRAIRVGNSICVTMQVDDAPQIYAADPSMMEYLANTYGEELDFVTAIKPKEDSYEFIRPSTSNPTPTKKKFW